MKVLLLFGLQTADHRLQTGSRDDAAANLERADTAWQRLCNAERMPYKEVIRETRQALPRTSLQQNVDVVVLGGAACIQASFTAGLSSACTCSVAVHICCATHRPSQRFQMLPGTLGIFLACTLAKRGKRVVVVERGRLQGRNQEWNISRQDMQAHLLLT